MFSPWMMLCLTIVLAFMVTPPLAWGGDRITGRAFATRSEVIARRGMAATSQPLAMQPSPRTRPWA